MSADCIHAVQQVARPVGAHDANRDQPCLPLSMRKTNLARLLARRPDGIFVAPTEQGEIGPDLFQAACRMGLEGLVSKRRDRPYQPGRSASAHQQHHFRDEHRRL